MSTVEGNWTWSDAWVLTAACMVGTTPVKLADLIAAGDHINHAILLDEEINDGVARLAAAGLVRLDGDDIVVTSKGQQLYDEATASIRAVLECVDAVDRALNGLELPERIPRSVAISPAALIAAKERYRDDNLLGK